MKLTISVGDLSVRKNHKVTVAVLERLPDEYWYVIVSKEDSKNEFKAMGKTERLRLFGFALTS